MKTKKRGKVITTLKPGLCISRKGSQAHVCDHIFELSRLHRHVIVMVASIDCSQEIFAVDIITALKSSLKHSRKHVLRSLQLFGDQAQKIE